MAAVRPKISTIIALTPLPVVKVSAQALYNQRSVVQPCLISDLKEEIQHLIRFVALTAALSLAARCGASQVSSL